MGAVCVVLLDCEKGRFAHAELVLNALHVKLTQVGLLLCCSVLASLNARGCRSRAAIEAIC